MTFFFWHFILETAYYLRPMDFLLYSPVLKQMMPERPRQGTNSHCGR